jgi:hypothetical protein
MRFARKLTLLAVAAVAALAVMAPNASALGGIEVTNDKAAGAHCTTSTCLVHFEGTAELTAHFLGFGIHEATCTAEVELKLDEDGGGSTNKLTNKTPGDANCSTVAPSCSLPWNGTGEEDAADQVLITTTGVCINPAESDTDCTGDFQITLTASKSNEDKLTAATTSSQNLGQCEIDYSGSAESTSSSYADPHVTHL